MLELFQHDVQRPEQDDVWHGGPAIKVTADKRVRDSEALGGFVETAELGDYLLEYSPPDRDRIHQWSMGPAGRSLCTIPNIRKRGEEWMILEDQL